MGFGRVSGGKGGAAGGLFVQRQKMDKQGAGGVHPAHIRYPRTRRFRQRRIGRRGRIGIVKTATKLRIGHFNARRKPADALFKPRQIARITGGPIGCRRTHQGVFHVAVNIAARRAGGVGNHAIAILQ